MGNSVLNATSGMASLDSAVRAYAHCGLPPSPHLPPAVLAQKNPMGLALINLNSTAPKRVQLIGTAAGTAWVLSVGAGGFFGTDTLLNELPLPAAIVDGKAIEAIPVSPSGMPVPAEGSVTLPPFSVCFVATECTKSASAIVV